MEITYEDRNLSEKENLVNFIIKYEENYYPDNNEFILPYLLTYLTSFIHGWFDHNN